LPPTCARLPIASIRQYRTPRRPSQRRDLMEIVEDRRGSILITRRLPVAAWHEVIGEPMNPPSVTRYRTALSTMPTGSNSTVRQCAKSRPSKQSSRCPSTRSQLRRAGSGRREPGNDPRICQPGRPRDQREPRARVAASPWWAIRSARGSLLLTTGTASIPLDAT
jgi:hypothetical protein